eukprot:4136158-Pleurochrysis_carterae.AAC.4
MSERVTLDEIKSEVRATQRKRCACARINLQFNLPATVHVAGESDSRCSSERSFRNALKLMLLEEELCTPTLCACSVPPKPPFVFNLPHT